ncbi:MAG: hypothetical protein K0U37_04465 [Gammaproteobacteria bacterium]|nr:hypothetical protein [Gammaproteobacteria bacterium]
MVNLTRYQQMHLNRFITKQVVVVYEAFGKVIYTKEQRAGEDHKLTEAQEAIVTACDEHTQIFRDKCRDIFVDQSIELDEIEECFNTALDEWCDSFDAYPEAKAHPEWNLASMKEGTELSIADFFEELKKMPAEESVREAEESAMLMREEVQKTIKVILKKLDIPESQFDKQRESAFDLFRKKEGKLMFLIMKEENAFLNLKGESEMLSTPRTQLKFDMFSERQKAIMKSKTSMRFLDECKEDLDALVVFDARLTCAIGAYLNIAPIDQKQETFRKAIKEATDECVARYQKEVAPDILDYIKAVCLALVGVLVSIVTLPVVFASSHYRSQLKATFFTDVSPKMVDTPECDMIKDAMKDFESALPQPF